MSIAGSSGVDTKSTVCEICTKEPKKYKCPKCGILYCSVTCYKQHQNTDCGNRAENASIFQVIQNQSQSINEEQDSLSPSSAGEIRFAV
ncbi:ZNHIT3 [Bugula neritina]|uniref:ZNHIT3 n=1 Tax=Bugula neritina TaxID=10212 RepID=A0A7J7JX38_BUGNE|nr:ZNHIT3 [Bugula neritina]